MFDKLLRQTELAFRHSQAMDIEEMSTHNPTEFWQKIQRLGPRKNKSIHIELVDNGNIIRDENFVFEK
jgi:hypothetical protein